MNIIKRHTDWQPEIGDQVITKAHILFNKGTRIIAKLAPKYDRLSDIHANKFSIIFRMKEEKDQIPRMSCPRVVNLQSLPREDN
jgi:hypothetical protein